LHPERCHILVQVQNEIEQGQQNVHGGIVPYHAARFDDSPSIMRICLLNHAVFRLCLMS
jgi:DNA topoisomerase IB